MEHTYVEVYEDVIIKPLEEKNIESLRIWRNTKANTKYLNKLPFITTVLAAYGNFDDENPSVYRRIRKLVCL